MATSRQLLRQIPTGQHSWPDASFPATRYVIHSTSKVICSTCPLLLYSSNFGQLFDRHGWEFQDELGEKYQSVVKLQDTFSVSPLCHRSSVD